MPHHSGVSSTSNVPAEPLSSQTEPTAPTPAASPTVSEAAPATVTVRYWAAARAAAGRAQDQVPAGTLSEVLAAVLALHVDRPRLAQVVSVCSVLIGEDPVGSRDRDHLVVPAGASVELLPPFAGG
jgi:molybdopterin converting factor small subunit